jgi:cytoskeletal protein CcmA (bactofilin family)
MNRPDNTASERVSVLGPKSALKGDFATSEDLVILGTLDGKRVQSPKITIGPAARVRAHVYAGTIRIEGVVIGDIHAEVAVIVHASATVHGNIHCPEVTIQEGAQVNGALDQDSASDAGNLRQSQREVKFKTSKIA